MKGEKGMPCSKDGVPSGVEPRSIVWLPDVVGTLEPDVQRAFSDLFDLDVTVGELVLPEHMRTWVERYFGSTEAVVRQRIVKITNRWTLDATLFNELRARRPLEARIPAELADELARTAPDPFCEPEYNTPEDVFGRIRGQHVITASNIAKYDGLHGVIVFREHDPLAFDRAVVREMVAVAREWFARAHAVDPVAVYPLFMWNCLWKSGASIPHGHAQVSLTRRVHYGKVERERRAAVAYRHETGRGYFDDVLRVHERLGLGRVFDRVRVYASLTPLKEKETVLLAPAFDDALAVVMSEVVRCLVDELNVTSFNLVAWLPPLSATLEDWSDMPVVVRVVDRGDPLSRTSDFGAMELYAASVVASDPFRVAEVLWRCLAG
jgi:hypothetical protein